MVTGFEHFKMFWEPRWERYATKIKPGEFYITNQNMVITTVLGSCISACIHDPVTKFGGMNHFMLPAESEDQGRSMRYGLFAMEQLVNELMKRGCDRHRIQVKLTGGGDMMGGLTNIGQQNIDFIKQYIVDEGLRVLSTDLGGDQARRVAYFPVEGRLLVNKLDHRSDKVVIEEERNFSVDVDHTPDGGDVELF